jgi:hypothetical protein
MKKNEVINVINSLKKYSPVSDDIINRSIKALDDRTVINKRIEVLTNTLLNTTFNDIINSDMGDKLLSEFNAIENLAHDLSMSYYDLKKDMDAEISEEEYLDNEGLYVKVEEMMDYDVMISDEIRLLYDIKRAIDSIYDAMDEDNLTLTKQSDFFESFKRLSEYKRII